MKRLIHLIEIFGLKTGIKTWWRQMNELCGDCGKNLYRYTDWKGAGSHGAIDIDVGGHKKTVYLCWLCYYKNK